MSECPPPPHLSSLHVHLFSSPHLSSQPPSGPCRGPTPYLRGPWAQLSTASCLPFCHPCSYCDCSVYGPPARKQARLPCSSSPRLDYCLPPITSAAAVLEAITTKAVRPPNMANNYSLNMMNRAFISCPTISCTSAFQGSLCLPLRPSLMLSVVCRLHFLYLHPHLIGFCCGCIVPSFLSVLIFLIVT